MTKGWQIKDKDEVLTESKRLAKIRAAERGVSIAEAVRELVKIGYEATKGVSK